MQNAMHIENPMHIENSGFVAETPIWKGAVSMSKCNKVELIGPVGFEVKSVFGKEEFRRTFPT